MSFLVPEGNKLSERRMKRFGKVEVLVKPRGPKTSAFIFVSRLFKAFVKAFKKIQMIVAQKMMQMQ